MCAKERHHTRKKREQKLKSFVRNYKWSEQKYSTKKIVNREHDTWFCRKKNSSDTRRVKEITPSQCRCEWRRRYKWEWCFVWTDCVKCALFLVLIWQISTALISIWCFQMCHSQLSRTNLLLLFVFGTVSMSLHASVRNKRIAIQAETTDVVLLLFSNVSLKTAVAP